LLAENESPLNATHWTKSPTPVFVKDPANNAFGQGHNGFFKSLGETEDWIIYHAKNLTNQGCGVLRNPRIQKLTWNSNATPNFGVPVKIGRQFQSHQGKHEHFKRQFLESSKMALNGSRALQFEFIY
jgi:GH43 family beta-xylosidase